MMKRCRALAQWAGALFCARKGFRSDPQSGLIWRQPIDVPLTSMSLSLPLRSSLSQINKNVSLGKDLEGKKFLFPYEVVSLNSVQAHPVTASSHISNKTLTVQQQALRVNKEKQGACAIRQVSFSDVKCPKIRFFLFVIPGAAAFSSHPLCSYGSERQGLSICHRSTAHHTS